MEKELIYRRVFDAKPELERLLKTSGTQTIGTYFRRLSEATNPATQRATPLIDAVAQIVEQRLGKVHGENARRSLQKKYIASTADHHGPLCHPFFSHFFMAQALQLEDAEKTIVTLPCATISMSNSSFPRGIFFHDERGVLQKLPFIADKHDHSPMLSTPPFSKTTVERMEGKLSRFDLSPDARERLRDILKTVYLNEAVLGCPSYDLQTTSANHLLVKKVPGLSSVALYYIPLEVLASTLLETHLANIGFWSDFLTNDRTLSLFDEYFDGILSAHNHKKPERGTFLFWGLRGGRRIKLMLRDTLLQSSDGTFSIALTRDTLRENLRDRRIIPNLALSFLLTLYHDLPTGGGFSQINYLSDIKSAFIKLLETIGEQETAKQVSLVAPTIFMGELIGATLPSGASVTLVDAILYPETRAPESISATPLETGVMRMMPEFYKIITGEYPH